MLESPTFDLVLVFCINFSRLYLPTNAQYIFAYGGVHAAFTLSLLTQNHVFFIGLIELFPPPARGGRQNLICSLVWGGNYFRQGNSLAVEIFLARGI